MNLFPSLHSTHCKEVQIFSHPAVDLKAIMAINSTTLGPAICSCKMYPYANEEEAMQDALRLALHNTYSAALMKREVGGGSIVLLGTPGKLKGELYFRTLGRIIDQLKGKVYLTPESGTSSHDMLEVRRETPYVLALPEMHGGSGSTSQSVAIGILYTLKASLKFLQQEPMLSGVRVVVQGIGNIGKALIRLLIKEGAEVIACDSVYDKIKELQDEFTAIKVVRPQEISKQHCDIFCACAFGHTLNKDDAEILNCKIVAGVSSYSSEVQSIIQRKNILLLPPFLLNSGQFIQLCNELNHYSAAKTNEELKNIFHTTYAILNQSKEEGKFIHEVAAETAHNYLNQIASIKINH